MPGLGEDRTAVFRNPPGTQNFHLKLLETHPFCKRKESNSLTSAFSEPAGPREPAGNMDPAKKEPRPEGI